MRRIAAVWSIGLILSCLAAAGAAPRRKPEDRPVALQYVKGPIQTVFGDIAKQVGVGLQSDNAIGGSISLTIQDTSMSQVMDMICKSFHCTWSVRPGEPPTLVIVSKPPQ